MNAVEIACMIFECFADSECHFKLRTCESCNNFNLCKTNFYVIAMSFNMVLGGEYYG